MPDVKASKVFDKLFAPYFEARMNQNMEISKNQCTEMIVGLMD